MNKDNVFQMSSIKNIVNLNYERIRVEDSLNRISKENIYANSDINRDNISLYDGYLVSEKLINKSPCSIEVCGKIIAGNSKKNFPDHLKAIKINTGGVIPQYFDIVIKDEDVTKIGNRILISDYYKKGYGIEKKGSYFSKGTLIVSKDEMIKPKDIEKLVLLGYETIKVIKKPIISILGIGNELKELGKNLNIGEIYPSNAYYIKAKLETNNLDKNRIYIVRDNSLKIKKKLIKLINFSDIIITTGGTGNSDKDLIKECISELEFDLLYENINVDGKKIRVTVFKKVNTLIISLSGNRYSMKRGFNKVACRIIKTVYKGERIND